MSAKQHNRLPSKKAKLAWNFRARNEKQQQLIDLIQQNEVVIAKGVPGSGKTYVALATALNLLGETYKKIILVKSVVTLPGEDTGFLPGGIAQKMDPFIMSYTWNIDKICGEGSAKDLMDKKLVQVLPLAFIRGLSIDDSIVIIDETQNIDNHTFKTIMTRIGENSKYIFLGDSEQVDRKYVDESCLNTVVNLFSNTNIMGIIEFNDEDCVRNPIIPKILSVLRSGNI